MINNAEESGAPRNSWRRDLGEWVSRKGCANTHSRPKATPVRPNEPEGALALMMPEHNPLLSSSHAARCVTAVA